MHQTFLKHLEHLKRNLSKCSREVEKSATFRISMFKIIDNTISNTSNNLQYKLLYNLNNSFYCGAVSCATNIGYFCSTSAHVIRSFNRSATSGGSSSI